MRFLLLSNFEHPCGITDHSKALQDNLRLRGHRCDIYSIDVRQLKSLSLRKAKKFFTDFTEVSGGYDVLFLQHEHGIYNGSFNYRKSVYVFRHLVAMLSRKKMPLIIFFHSPAFYVKRIGIRALLDIFSPVKKNWDMLLSQINQNDRIHCFTHSARGKKLIENFGLSRERLTMCYHPIPKVNLKRNTFLAGGKGTPAMGIVTVGIFGFVTEYKGYNIALEALTLLPSNVKLRILGGKHPYAEGDDTFTRLQEFCAEILTNEVVRFQGKNFAAERFRSRIEVSGILSDESVDNELARLDVIWAPYTSAAPAGSAALSRALAAEKVVITSRIPAFAELEREFNCLRTLPVNNGEELAHMTLNLLKNREECEDLIENARRFATENNWQRLAAKVEAIADSLTA